MKLHRLVLTVLLTTMLPALTSLADDVPLLLRYQQETSAGSNRYHQLSRREDWKAAETAVIVCDVWDLHHSLNAVRRVKEMAPRLNQFVEEARRRGMTIIHAPSDCTDAYADHPARRRAIETPKSVDLPDDIQSWCSRIPAEEQAIYPLDQSDGGDDDDPAEHAQWAAELKKMGRNPGSPWQQQSDLIKIDAQADYVSDRGDEVWSILEQRGIKNVILTGVHTNMCVLGRPFGLRQMARNGKRVVLARDLTDTMYNPASWPYVSHFTGTDLIVSHIERFVCPTITSDQLIGGEEFRFQHDHRPHVVMVVAEDEYQTERTLPEFAAQLLGKPFRVSFVFGSDDDRNAIPGLDVLNSADVAVISARRRTPPAEQLAIVKRFVESGKPVVGIRTASHAFSLRGTEPPDGYAAWPEFDAQVFGGHYTNHYGNDLAATVSMVPDAAAHPILSGISREPFKQAGSLYKTSPLANGTATLLLGHIDGHADEPVAWTFQRADGGRSFYTSMGHPQDFDNANFRRLLRNAIYWAAGMDVPVGLSVEAKPQHAAAAWALVAVPAAGDPSAEETLPEDAGPAWYRCSIRLRDRWIDPAGVLVDFPPTDGVSQVWFNGQLLPTGDSRTTGQQYLISRDWIEVNDANLLVVRVEPGAGERRWQAAPRVLSGQHQMELKGRWQFRLGDDPAWSNLPLPARYGTSTDIVFEPY